MKVRIWYEMDIARIFVNPYGAALAMANARRRSMDGNGAWRDNVFVERLWRTVEYEEVR